MMMMMKPFAVLQLLYWISSSSAIRYILLYDECLRQRRLGLYNSCQPSTACSVHYSTLAGAFVSADTVRHRPTSRPSRA